MTPSLEQFVPRVYRLALRLSRQPAEAEDLTQEVMLRAWRQRRRLRDPQAAQVWLFRITINLWKDKLRQRRRKPFVSGIGAGFGADVGGDVEDLEPCPVQKLVRKEQLERSLQALDSLPARQRQVLYLHVCEGLALTEISQMLQASYQAVKASLCEARKKMRRELADLLQEIDT